jgi:hypothetical protein
MMLKIKITITLVIIKMTMLMTRINPIRELKRDKHIKKIDSSYTRKKTRPMPLIREDKRLTPKERLDTFML